MDYKELTEMRWWYDPTFEYYRYEKGLFRDDGKPGFPTPTGRVELYSTVAESLGAPPLPYYGEPFEGPYSTPEKYKEYPVITLTGTRHIGYFHSEGKQIAELREICPDPMVEINPEFANDIGVKEGDWIWVENTIGRCRQRAHLTTILDYRVINLQSGWWYPEIDPHEDPFYDCWDTNPNNLQEVGHFGVTGFGSDGKAFLCKVYKVKEGEMDVGSRHSA
jgi:anaerobic selenocysteine-containing dehydrogenase